MKSTNSWVLLEVGREAEEKKVADLREELENMVKERD